MKSIRYQSFWIILAVGVLVGAPRIQAEDNHPTGPAPMGEEAPPHNEPMPDVYPPQSLERKEILTLWENEKHRKATQEIEKWKARDKKNADPWVVEASLKYDQKKYRQVIKLCKKALKLAPNNSEAYYWRGRAYEAKNKPLEAANEYRAALIARKDFSDAQVSLNRVLLKLKNS